MKHIPAKTTRRGIYPVGKQTAGKRAAKHNSVFVLKAKFHWKTEGLNRKRAKTELLLGRNYITKNPFLLPVNMMKFLCTREVAFCFETDRGIPSGWEFSPKLVQWNLEKSLPTYWLAARKALILSLHDECIFSSSVTRERKARLKTQKERGKM